jgi:hypothetical protein
VRSKQRDNLVQISASDIDEFDLVWGLPVLECAQFIGAKSVVIPTEHSSNLPQLLRI